MPNPRDTPIDVRPGLAGEDGRSSVPRTWSPRAALGIVALAACALGLPASRERAPTPLSAALAPTPLSAALAPAPPRALDLGALQRQVHFAYRQDAAGFVARHATYQSRVGAHGEIDVSATGGASMSFGPRSIERGGASIAPAGHPASASDGGLLTLRGGVTERLRNAGEGVEASWVFDAAPPRSGDLLVRTATRGAPYRGATGAGLHFGGVGGAPGLRFGRATWIDARGARTDVEPRLEGGAVVLRVPARAVDDAAYPAVLDPVIGPEIALDAPALGPSASLDGAPRLATNGAFFLAAWGTTDAGFVNPRVQATRVAFDGSLLDPTGFVVAAPGGSPDVACDGTDFLLVWNAGGVSATRVSAAGTVLDAPPISVSQDAFAENAVVAWSGSAYLLLWDRFVGGHAVVGAVVDASGAVISGAVTTPLGGSSAGIPAIACGAGVCVAVYDGGGPVQAARLAPDGTAIDTTPIPVAPAGDHPAIAFDGTDFLIAYAGTGQAIQVARIDTNGVITGVATQVGYTPLSVAIAASPSGSLVAWPAVGSGGAFQIQGARLSPGGALLDATPLALGTSVYDEERPAVAFAGSEYLVAWMDARNGANAGDVYAARVGLAGSVLDANNLLLSKGPNSETAVAAASDGAGYLVVWSDTRGEAGDIYGARLAGDGTVLDAAGIAIAVSPGKQFAPAVGFDGTNYLVAWDDQRFILDANVPLDSILAARVSPAGVLLDPAAIEVRKTPSSSGGTQPAIGCGGGACLVAWSDPRNGATPGEGDDLYAARVDPSGTVLDALGFPVSTATGDQTVPAIAWDGSNFFVSWQDGRNPDPDVFGARVSAAGVVLDPGGVFVSSDGLGVPDVGPSVAWDGQHHVVVWDRQGDIVGARVGADGAVADATAIVISNALGVQTAPRVVAAGDGHNVFVVWQDHRSGTNDDVYGAFVSSAGSVLEPLGVPLAANSADESAPAIAARGGGHMLAAYQATDAATGLPRARARLVDGDALDGATCQAASDCASRQCVDGFCCQRACDPACETCAAAGTEGACTCTGKATCTSDPMCKVDLGAPCASGSDCSTTHCADGVCCDAACDGGCDRCNTMAGTCTPLAKGILGSAPACMAGYLCDGTSGACPTTCADDSFCAGGYYCSSKHACEPLCGSDADCAPGTHCDRASGKCVEGATCDGDHTLTEADGTSKDCAPYVCTTEGTCLSSCTSSADCVAGKQCDEANTCARPVPFPLLAMFCATPWHAAPRAGGGLLLLGLWAIAAARRRGRPREENA